MEIYNADCFEILPKIKKDSINLVLVDLPYGQTNHKWDIEIDLNKMWDELKRCCKKNCIYAFFCTTLFGYKLIQSNPVWFSYDLVWEKLNAVGFLSAKKNPLRKHEMIYIFKDFSSNDRDRQGFKELREYSKSIMDFLDMTIKEINKKMGNQGMCHFLCYRGEQYSLPTKVNYKKFTEIFEIDKMEGFKTYEEMLKLWKKYKLTFVYNPQMEEGKPYKTKGGEKLMTPYGYKKKSTIDNKGTRYPASILKFGFDKEKLHRTQKPVKLCEWLIKTYTNEGDTVLDFTMGSGTTGVACKNTNRKFIGIEKEEEIYKIAFERLNN